MSVREVVNRPILCRLVILGCLSIQGLGRAAMWPQIVGRSILTSDHPRRSWSRPWQEAFFLLKGRENEKGRARARAKGRETSFENGEEWECLRLFYSRKKGHNIIWGGNFLIIKDQNIIDISTNIKSY